MPTRADAEALDRADTLAPLRDRFQLPDGIIYFDGNSLGPLPKSVAPRIGETIASGWGEGLIRSWNTHDWIDLPLRLGDRIAPLIGAPSRTVVVADSTSVNIFKTLGVASRLRPDRRVILTEAGGFSTDGYMAQGFARWLGQGYEVRAVARDAVAQALDDSVAAFLLAEVDYRTGARFDMHALTAEAHRHGALAIWDLAHSVGAFPVDVTTVDADLAVGCGFKYLNGGPGAPAFVYVAPRHLAVFEQPLAGWLGHAAPFAFEPDYQPAPGIAAMRVGTPPILSMVALDAALDAFDGVDLAAVKAKADALFALFAGCIAELDELSLASPTDPTARGTQISLRHPEAYAVMQALIARGVIGDFRQPDIIRFGLTPLYLRFVDVFDAAATLREVLATRAWDTPEFRRRAKVV